jgi:large subunit ribosomal protein L2
MGTRLVNQRRGKGGPTFRTPKHRFFGSAKYVKSIQTLRGQVMGLLSSPAHSTVMADVMLDNGENMAYLAAEGLKKGAMVGVGPGSKLAVGNVLPLGEIPEGQYVFNVELVPQDGGRLARASGSSCLVMGHDEDTGKTVLRLSSKRVKHFSPSCSATIGVPSGSGRKEKPFMKAGNHYYAMKAKNKYWPIVRGTAKSAYDHPHGGRSFGKSSSVARNTPPGGKVGHIASRRTGRRRGRVKVRE